LYILPLIDYNIKEITLGGVVMLSIYSSEENKQLTRLENIEPGCWINLIDPLDKELIFVSKTQMHL